MSTLTLNSDGAIIYKNKMFNFYIEQKFVDTKLVLADGDIRSHSVVLASESKKLYNMLIDQKETQKTLTLTQFSKGTMRVVLEYIYRGIVTYPSENDEAVMMAISFFELNIKTDGCKVEFSSDETDNSVVEVKIEESLIEISDNEIETGTGTIQDEQKSEHFTPSPSSVFDQSYDFISACNRNLQFEDPPSPSESCNRNLQFEDPPSPSESCNRNLQFEDPPSPSESCPQQQPEKNSPTIADSNPKRKKMEGILKNPFSQYVNKNSENKQPGTSHQQNNQCTSESTPQNQATKTPNNNIWTNKKDNSCEFPKKYCLICEEKQNYFKTHIKTFHKGVIRFPTLFCAKCSSYFYYQAFFKNHVQTCSK